MTRIHTIPFDHNRDIVYCPDTIRFFVAKSSLVPLIRRISNGATLEELVVEGIDISSDKYGDIRGKIMNERACPARPLPSGHLSRLVLNISNDCNMRCRYCYANCGDYGGERNLIRSETLRKALDYFCDRFEEIAVVQLFGGEPTLNIPMMEYACTLLHAAKPNTKIGFVTNGAIVNDKLLDLINKYSLNVTVSIDARSLQDELRPFRETFRRGKGLTTTYIG